MCVCVLLTVSSGASIVNSVYPALVWNPNPYCLYCISRIGTLMKVLQSVQHPVVDRYMPDQIRPRIAVVGFLEMFV
uniref:Putative secreted protein n=1 Tax=Anopheles marajoara TaxID=58244 RepID=A0A2M4CDS9_9DIPT